MSANSLRGKRRGRTERLLRDLRLISHAAWRDFPISRGGICVILGGGGPQIDDGIIRAAQLKERERELNIPRGKIVSISPSLSSADTRIMDTLRIKTQNIYMTR